MCVSDFSRSENAQLLKGKHLPLPRDRELFQMLTYIFSFFFLDIHFYIYIFNVP